MAEAPLPWPTARLVAFWLPLALSWLMMAVAQPVVAAGISRLANPDVHLAAFGVTLDLAVLIESPIIMLFSASVALTRTQAAYRVLRRFMVVWAAALTTLFVIVAFTRLSNVVLAGLIGVPPAVLAEAKPALRWLLPWVPAIAWRRFYQGPLLLANAPRLVGYGTLCRLAALAGTVILGVAVGLPGAVMGAMALSASVVVEAVIVTLWALPRVRQLPPGAPGALTGAAVVRFCLPLAATDLMRVIARPMVTAGIARAALPGVSLAAWPVAYGFMNLVAAGVMAFQEMVVAVQEQAGGPAVVTRFVMWTGLGLTAVLALVAFTPLVDLYVGRIISLPPLLRDATGSGLRAMVALPWLLALRNLYRGALIAAHRTDRVQLAMAGHLVVLGIALTLGARAGGPGILVAAWAVLLAQGVEVLLLLGFARERARVSAGLPQAAGR